MRTIAIRTATRLGSFLESLDAWMGKRSATNARAEQACLPHHPDAASYTTERLAAFRDRVRAQRLSSRADRAAAVRARGMDAACDRSVAQLRDALRALQQSIAVHATGADPVQLSDNNGAPVAAHDANGDGKLLSRAG